MRPRNSLVLVRILPQEKNRKTEQGIIIPDTKGNGGFYKRAVVLDTGPGMITEGEGKRVGMDDLRTGQLVLIKAGVYQQVNDIHRAVSDYGARVQVNGEELVLINQIDILAIIEETYIPPTTVETTEGSGTQIIPAGDDLNHGFITGDN
jgi:co-chaperonin GroES (HSP10)